MPFFKTTFRSLIFIVSLLFVHSTKGQDIHFSQYDMSPLILNPALTAVDKNLQVAVQHKEQWKVMNAYSTSGLSFEMKFDPTSWIKQKGKTLAFKHKKPKGFAFGINLLSDRAGDGNMQKLFGNLSLAYHLMVSETSRMSAGIQGGVVQRSINPAGLRYNSQYSPIGVFDPYTESGELYSAPKTIYGDFAAGICYSAGTEDKYMAANDNKYFKIGVSFNHISKPEQAFIIQKNSKIYLKYTAHANGLIGIKNTPYALGGSLLFMQQGKQHEFSFGALVKYKLKEESKYTGIKKGMAISLGCYYRNGDALIPVLSYELGRYSIGVSYDLNLSPLKTATSMRGGIEVTLRFFNPVAFLYQKRDGASFN